MWLAILSFIVLNVILILICVCTCLKRHKRPERLYRYTMPIFGSGGRLDNNPMLSNKRLSANTAYDSMLSFSNSTARLNCKLYKPSWTSSARSSETYTKPSNTATAAGSNVIAIPRAKLVKAQRCTATRQSPVNYDTTVYNRNSKTASALGHYGIESNTNSEIGSGSYVQGITSNREQQCNDYSLASSETTGFDQSESLQSGSGAYYKSRVIQL